MTRHKYWTEHLGSRQDTYPKFKEDIRFLDQVEPYYHYKAFGYLGSLCHDKQRGSTTARAGKSGAMHPND